jgi:hypothetical protein
MIGFSLYALHPFDKSVMLLVLPFLIGVVLFIAAGLFRYTYGEINEDGIRYRRLWGWRTAAWSEIASADFDAKVKNAIVIRLNHGNQWASRLFFPEIWKQTSEERQEIIRLCRQRLVNPAIAIHPSSALNRHG